MKKVISYATMLMFLMLLPALAAGKSQPDFSRGVNIEPLERRLAAEAANAMAAGKYATKCNTLVNNLSNAELKNLAPAEKIKFQAKTLILASLLAMHKNIDQIKTGKGSLVYYDRELKRAVTVLVVNPMSPAANNY